MKPEIFENNAEGIKQVYRNNEWSVSIKRYRRRREAGDPPHHR